MKTTLFAIALTAASLPLTFAAQTMPAVKPAAQTSSAAASKKSVKKVRRSAKPAVKNTGSTGASSDFVKK
jgi:hypothetical protein